MSTCNECKNWTTRRVTDYGSGDRITNWAAPDGKGACSELKIETDAEFGCNKFAPFDGGAIATTSGTMPALNPHWVRNWKNGAPWMHSQAGPCPDCRGKGSDHGTCMRCVGTGKVRYYDDGFIGEERTRLHPKEKEQTEPLKCPKCKNVVDIRWVACPLCGHRLEGMADPESVGLGNQGQTGKSQAREQFTEEVARDIDSMNERNEKIAKLRRMTVENNCTPEEAATAKEMADKLEAMQ